MIIVIDEFKAYLDNKKIEDDKEFLSKVQFLTNEIKISTDEKVQETLYFIADKINIVLINSSNSASSILYILLIIFTFDLIILFFQHFHQPILALNM